MIRRDYILRMVAEFLEVLSRVQSLKQRQLWQEARGNVDDQCRRIVGKGAKEVVQLSETELLAQLIEGEPTQVVRDKVFILTRLLKESGDIACGEGRPEEGRAFYLKGLHLLLYALSQGDPGEWPDFLPRVDMMVAALGDAPLPLATHAALMQHFERTRQFGRAEDSFFSMLETEPGHPGIIQFGIAFYERLRSLPDAILEEGNLPRAEVESGRAELQAREVERDS